MIFTPYRNTLLHGTSCAVAELARWLGGKKIGFLQLPDTLENKELKYWRYSKDPNLVWVIWEHQPTTLIDIMTGVETAVANAPLEWYVLGYYQLRASTDFDEITAQFDRFNPASAIPEPVLRNESFKVLSYSAVTRLFEVQLLTPDELQQISVLPTGDQLGVEDLRQNEQPTYEYRVDLNNLAGRLIITQTGGVKFYYRAAVYLNKSEEDFISQLGGAEGHYALVPRFCGDEIIAVDLKDRVMTREDNIENLLFFWSED